MNTPKEESARAVTKALTHDQCHYGFEHTAETIVLWLCECTIEAGESLRHKIAANLADMKRCQAQVDATNARYADK